LKIKIIYMAAMQYATKKIFVYKWLICIAMLWYTTILNTAQAQSLTHPHIWVSNADKEAILNNINQYTWAESLYNQLVTRQSALTSNHKANPRTLLATIPAIPGDRAKHREILNNAAECAILYYLTSNADYAQVAADVLHNYVVKLENKDPLNFDFYTPAANSNHLINTRETFPRIAIVYDFIQPFLINTTTTVYNITGSNRTAFNMSAAQKSFEFMVTNVLKVGGTNSNHPILELTGGLYPALCITNDTKRNDLFDKLYNGDTKQNGISWMLENFTNEGLWPEAFSYSKITHETFLKALNVVDRYKPDLGILSKNKRLFDGVFTFENFNYPNGQMMAFGDSNRDDVDNTNALRMVLAICNRLSFNTYRQKTYSFLKSLYDKNGGYQPEIYEQTLEWDNPLQLLWGVNIPGSVTADNQPIYTTFSATYAGVIAQRNYVESNNHLYGLMYYTGGGTYVHAHATGIDMELYGQNYVIGPDFGRDTYGEDLHEQYAVSHAAHNTVIVNGTSKRGEKTNGNSTWQNIVAPIVLQAAEPAQQATATSTNFSFSTQYLDDVINNASQQRTNAIVRTSNTSGYYVDFFRSTSKETNNYHDYIFHGLGDALSLKSANTTLALTSTPNRFQKDIGDDRKQPGWRWFANTKTSEATTNNIKARFNLNATSKYLHVTIPSSISRIYSTATAPATKKVTNGYDAKETQVLVMRKNGEAWNLPFVALYEPSGTENSTIKSADLIKVSSKVVGVKVVSTVSNKDITDIIIANDADDVMQNFTNLNITFKGRFAIVRTYKEGTVTKVTLYIGKGSSIAYGGKTLTADNQGKGLLNFDLMQTSTQTSRVLNAAGSNLLHLENPIQKQNNVTIDASWFNSTPKTVQLFSNNGTLIQSNNFTADKALLTTQNVKAGIYFVKIKFEDNNTVTKKILLVD
jgi:hypothetical protein